MVDDEADGAVAEGAQAGRRLRNGLISLGILVALVVGLLLAVPGLHGVARAVTRMKSGWLVLAVGLEIGSCLGYVLAFLHVFYRAPRRFGARVALSELAFNSTVSLGGAGSVAVGAWLLVERGGSVSRVAERSTTLFLLTTAINVVTFVLAAVALFTGVLPGPGNTLLSVIPAAVGAIAFVLVLLIPRVIDRAPSRKPPRRVFLALCTLSTGIRSTERILLRPNWGTVGAIAYLWCDIGVLIACFAAAGASMPLAAIVLAYQIAYMSNIIPVPGGIGVLDGSLVGALVLYGAGATAATAATVVYHAIALWIPAVWGTIAFVLVRRNREEPLQLRPERGS